jgi:uncharacterized membrane protein YgcG
MQEMKPRNSKENYYKAIIFFLIFISFIACLKAEASPNQPKSVQFVEHFFDNLGWAFLVALIIAIIRSIIMNAKRKPDK